ncbi:hypothetical protein PoB_003513600 [Plakobranchus ocellatus]|uniref:Uncharacterized protein n=1 Tax=Plakobranchus ocellatus TaxID=259542 RepID=A0AAV4AK07_9GAST|nr:hypothetical protein PoB_003513600 [Plakobranchus ocellatus]
MSILHISAVIDGDGKPSVPKQTIIAVITGEKQQQATASRAARTPGTSPQQGDLRFQPFRQARAPLAGSNPQDIRI